MKKSILVLSFLVLNTSFIYSQSIRNVNFGMTLSEVKNSESTELVTSQNQDYLEVLAYQDNVGGLDAFIMYIFAKDLLTRARYAFREEHSNKNLYIDDFQKINNILTKKYGPPLDDKTYYWNDDLYKDDSSDYGMAIAVGHLGLQSKWEQDGMIIMHVLSGDNYEISHNVEYQSKRYIKLEEEARKNANMSDF